MAALDPESLQLFTFYKKVDVLKDQKTILAKFGQILRSNSCTIAYKAAARAPDLFKPENARLYRLFVSAILASTKLSSVDSRQIAPLGQRYHAIEVLPNVTEFATETLQTWQLLRTDLQVVLSGQVIITISYQRALIPLTNSENNIQQVNSEGVSSKALPVTLSPTGQLAVFRSGWIGRLEDGHPVPAMQNSRSLASLRVWQKRFFDWCRSESYAQPDANDLWAELVIPVQERLTPETAESPKLRKPEPRGAMTLRSFFWPAKWCFALDLSRGILHQKIESEADYDPVQLIVEWIERVAGGNFGLGAEEAADTMDHDDGSILPDYGNFDNPESFQPFGPPIFPTAQTVYPTPPDVIMTHATPGMSSVDGLAPTPVTIHRTSTEDTAAGRNDIERADRDATHDNDVGTGLYDEDLFDDMPEDAFGETATGDEPNWDFFDKPSAEAENDMANGEDDDAMELDHAAQANDHSTPNLEVDGNEVVSMSSKVRPEGVLDGRDGVVADDVQDPAETGTATKITRHGQDENDAASMEERPFSLAEDHSIARRRSSIFDGITKPRPTPSRDQRYSASGPFFFGVHAKLNDPQNARNLDRWIQRDVSPSDTSDSEDDTDEFPYTGVSPLDVKVHSPETVEGDTTMLETSTVEPTETEVEAADTDAQIVLDLVSLSSTRSSLDEAVTLGRPAGLPSSFNTPQNRVDFAFELVRQLTQTCLLQDVYGTHSLVLDGSSRNEVLMNVGGSEESSAYSSILQLHSLGPQGVGKPSTGRLLRLDEPSITLQREDDSLTAWPTIIPFWDTLGLQPHTQPKDVSAICIHAHVAGLQESCSHFLDRVSDAYVTCNLGHHRRGVVENITSDGLLEASAEEAITRLSGALQSTPGSGNLVVYIVALSQQEMAFVNATVQSFVIQRKVQQQREKSKADQLNLIFQVVPPDFVASSQELVVPSQNDYNALALGVFSRLPPHESDAPVGQSNYPVVLAEGWAGVKFRLNNSTVSPYLHDGFALHLAYAYSEDRRWLLAVWTDTRGMLAFFVPYELKSFVIGPGRTIEEIIKDIWTVSHELMSHERYPWRLIVSKNGTYEPPEINAWMTLTNNQTNNNTTTTTKPKCTLYLLSIELNPAMRIFPPLDGPKANNTTTTGQHAYGTPASTPQGGITSPEQLVAATPAPTPGGSTNNNNQPFSAPTPPEHAFDPNTDADLTLHDPTSEAHIITLPYGINQSKDILEMRPAVASGYLIKRIGKQPEDGITMLGAHLIWPTPSDGAAQQQGQRERELEGVLVDFRGLAVLAGVRGVVDARRSVVPWHLHTAVSGAAALGRLI